MHIKHKKTIAVILGLIDFSFTFTLIFFVYRYMWFSIETTTPMRWFVSILGALVFNILFFAFVNIEKPFAHQDDNKK